VSFAIDSSRPAALFPGQGSHTPDMRERVERRAPELLERCVALVGEDPFARVEQSTRFAQPAIFCASLAGWDALGLEPGAAAGHSLGELAALAAAGVLDRDDALRLVVLRGRLMADADDRGSMLALVGASEEEAAEVARAAGVTVANDNAPGQVVLSGDRDDLARAEELARTIAAFPQVSMRGDRRSAYEQIDLDLGEALQNELRHGLRALASAEAAAGAQRFASGAGRHGS
jgi:malonyl CoA-acyl carrier protein transacylase